MSSEDRSLVIASGNAGKVAEFRQLLRGYPFEVQAQGDFNVSRAPEPAMTFVENALHKARHCARHTGLPSLADDSGLVVEFLGGAPGVHSAHYAGKDIGAAARNTHLLAALEDAPAGRRQAYFHCVLVLLRGAGDPAPLLAQGSWHGRIAQAARGTAGFGYDPIFIPDGHEVTVAELGPVWKNRMSHRFRAWNALAGELDAGREQPWPCH